MSIREFWIGCLVLIALATSATACTKANQPGSSIAVLVVDDFDGQPAVPPSSSTPLDKVDCAYTDESTQDVGSKGASGGSLPAGVAHGTVVFDELRRAMGQPPTKLRPVPTPSSSYPAYGLNLPYVHDVDVWSDGATEVALVGVDVAHYETRALTTDLQGVIDSMRASQHAFQRFVINMSFVVAPCDVQPYVSGATDLVDAYYTLISSQPDLGALRSTLDALVQAGGSETDMRDRLTSDTNGLQAATQMLMDPNAFVTLPEAVRLRLFYGLLEQDGGLNRSGHFFPAAAFQQLIDDPLRTWLDNLVKSAVVVPVAAAGNGVGYAPASDPVTHAGDGETVKIRLDFPFAPAIWNSVVSVSATETDPHAASADPRARYSNGGEVMLDGRYTFQTTDLRGTSFAAPRLAYLEALYLLGGGVVPCGPAVPPLGYSDMEDGHPSWDNLTVAAAAVRSQCAGFTPVPASPTTT